MPSLIYHLPETPIVFVQSGGTVVLSLGSLANGAGRISAQYDRGAGAKPGLYTIQAKIKPSGVVSLGAPVYVHFLQTAVAGDVPGNLGTSDAAVTSADKLRNLGAPVLIPIGDSVTSGENQITNSAIIEVYGRYISVFVWNSLGIALDPTGTNSLVTLVAVPPQSQ